MWPGCASRLHVLYLITNQLFHYLTVFLSEPGSPGPIDLDALSAIDQRRKSKRPRTAFTPTQLKGLEYYFRLCPYPDSMGRDVISRVTGIDDPRIQVWFQNRRARYRKREQGIKTTTSSSTTSPAPSQPHTTHTLTLKPIQPPTPSPMLRPSPPPLKSITPGTPPTLPTPPLTPGMLGSYYAAMAYHMQRFQQTTPGMPTYLPLPLPYFLPVTQSKPQDKQT